MSNKQGAVIQVIAITLFTVSIMTAIGATKSPLTGNDKSGASGRGYSVEMARSIIANGGGASKSELYGLKGVVGQPLTTKSTSVSYQLTAGFWQENRDLIFFNEFE